MQIRKLLCHSPVAFGPLDPFCYHRPPQVQIQRKIRLAGAAHRLDGIQ